VQSNQRSLGCWFQSSPAWTVFDLFNKPRSLEHPTQADKNDNDDETVMQGSGTHGWKARCGS